LVMGWVLWYDFAAKPPPKFTLKNMKHRPTGYNVRNINKFAVLDLIRFTPGGISRAEMARHIGLSRAAVTSITNHLLACDLVRETGGQPTAGGRRPILLEINPARGYVAGIDIGATHLGLVLADLSAQVIQELFLPFDVSKGAERCLRIVDEKLHILLARSALPLERLLAIGVGVPGPVVADAGAVVDPPIMPGWGHFPIVHHLETRWQTPVLLNNDAELGALGEWAYGAGRGEGHLAYIKVGSGVGAGFLLEGSLYRGATGSAGEIGHMSIDPHGPICQCGNQGCLETMAGGRAIANRAQEAVASGQRTVLASIYPLEVLSAKDVGQAAARGDLLAQKIVADAGMYLGTAIANMIHLFNPGLVVVGGGVAQMGDLLLEPIRKIVLERSLRAAAPSMRISAAVLGHRSSSIGAVVQASTTALNDLATPPPLFHNPPTLV